MQDRTRSATLSFFIILLLGVIASCEGDTTSTTRAELETDESDRLAAEGTSTQSEPENEELRALATEAMDLYERIGEYLADVPQDDIERVLRGEIHEQEVLGMGDTEYAVLLSELQSLAERGKVLAEEHGDIIVPSVLPRKNTGKKPTECRRWAYGICLIGAAIASAGAPGSAVIIYFTAGYVCFCGFCEGAEVDKVCG
jgi:hypothetical protein